MGTGFFENGNAPPDPIDASQGGAGFFDGGPAYTKIDPVAIQNFTAQAAASAAAAAAQEIAAAAQAGLALQDETAAANSAQAASTSATNAHTSEVNAAASASAASTSATNSANSATASASSASAAAGSATAASGSATAASTSATNAGNSATASAGSASAASTSASNAHTSEVNAGNSATAAATSATNAASAVQAAAGTATPLIDGVAAVGTGTKWAREDHKHPADTVTADARIANAAGTVTPASAGTAVVGTSTKWAHEDHVHPTDATRAPLASPALTGAPTAPTPTAGDNTTKLATTAFVTTALTSLRAKANTDYYVATTGSDTTGTGAIGSPWATIQKAINVLLTLDLAGQLVTVHVSAGTYTAGFSLTTAFVGGTVLVTGDTTTPSNVLISPASGGNPFEVSGVGSQISVSGFKTVSSGGAIHCYAHDGGLLTIQTKWEFGAATISSHITATRGGAVQFTNGTSYTISGSANFHFNINAASRLVCNVATVTLTGTPAFASAFASVNSGGNLQIISTTFTGSATGTKNTVATGGGVDTGGGSAANALFPGSVSGTTTTPGWWA